MSEATAVEVPDSEPEAPASEDTSALAPAKPRYKHCCDVFDLAPMYRGIVRNADGTIEEVWTHYQAGCLPEWAVGSLAPEVQAAIDSGLVDHQLQAAIRDAIPVANANDPDSAVHAAMPLDATETV